MPHSQLPSLPAVCAALVGLTLYDSIGTLSAVSAAAAAASDSMAGAAGSASAGTSVMEGVAQARLSGAAGLGAAPWQPGLLTVSLQVILLLIASDCSWLLLVASSCFWLLLVASDWLLAVSLQGRVTDALGLGDVVAPSILAGWAHRFDRSLAAADREASAQTGSGEDVASSTAARAGEDIVQASTTTGTGDGDGDGAGAGAGAGRYLGTALVGYSVGCVLLEVAPQELTRAALLFLVPSMLAAVLGRLTLQGDLGRAFATGSQLGARGE